MDIEIWFMTFLGFGWLAYYIFAKGQIEMQRQLIEELEAQVKELMKKG